MIYPRRERARAAALARWADADQDTRRAATDHARAAFLMRFQHQAEAEAPGRPADEQAARARDLMREYYAGLARRSAAARRQSKARRIRRAGRGGGIE